MTESLRSRYAMNAWKVRPEQSNAEHIEIAQAMLRRINSTANEQRGYRGALAQIIREHLEAIDG